MRTWPAQPGGDGTPAYVWVVDNVPLMLPWDLRAQVLDGWRAPTPAGRTLLTTRDMRVADGFVEERLEELGELDALRLLARFRPIADVERGEAEDTACRLAADRGHHERHSPVAVKRAEHVFLQAQHRVVQLLLNRRERDLHGLRTAESEGADVAPAGAVSRPSKAVRRHSRPSRPTLISIR